MSLLNNAVVPIAVVGLYGLAFVLGVGHYSQEQTAAHLRQIEQHRAEAEVVRRSEETTRLQALNVRVAAARAQQAQLAAAMKKAAQAAALVAPRLAGQEPWYVRSQHLKFKEGVRGQHPHDIYGMHLAMAASLIYNVEVLDKVVVCIASLITEKTVERSKRDAAAGKQHYAVCATCHGVNAEGIETRQAPALNNQHARYLETQLKHFKYGLRGNHKSDIAGRRMVPVMQALKDETVVDLVAYIQSRNDL